MNEPYTQAKAYLQTHMPRMLEDIAGLIAIPSQTEDRAAARRALAQVLARAEEMGFETRTVCGGDMGTVTMGQGRETVGILAHVDVVPGGDSARWASPPYSAQVRNGRLYGRGAQDDKGPLYAALYAMKAVETTGEPLKRRMQLIIGTMEETVWEDMARFRRECPLPDFGFTPDGEFPLTNGEKGYADAVLRFTGGKRKAGALILTGLRGGEASNVIPGSAEALLAGAVPEGVSLPDRVTLAPGKDAGTYRLFAEGVSAHSSVPEKGENAICRLCSALWAFPIAPGPPAHCAAFVRDCLAGQPAGQGLGLPQYPEEYNGEYVHHTIVSPTVLTSDADSCSLTLNFRISFPMEKRSVEGALAEMGAKYGFTFSFPEYKDPLFIPASTPFVQLLSRAYAEVTGAPAAPGLACGLSYAHALPNIVSYGPSFPSDADSCHEANESIALDSLQRAACVYAKALLLLLAAEGPLR